MDAINDVMDSFSDRSEFEGNSRNESNTTSNNQSDSSSEHWENEEESKSSGTKNDSKHTIGSPNPKSDPKFGNKSEQQQACPNLIPKVIIEPCFSYNQNVEECKNPYNPKERSKDEVDENSENYIDWYLRRLQGESNSQDENEFKQTQLEKDLNHLSISTSQ